MTWNVTEITLEARYMSAHAPDTLTLACRSISELPAEYYADTRSADGFVTGNLKEPPSLLIEGISREGLAALTWHPTDLSFTDRRTGKTEIFRVERRHANRPDALRLAIE